jgi:hypothetical protein
MPPRKAKATDAETGPKRDWNLPVTIGSLIFAVIVTAVNAGICFQAQDQAELQGQVRDLLRDIDGLSGRIDEMSGELSTLRGDVTAISEAVSAQSDGSTDVEGATATPAATPQMVGRKIAGVAGTVDDSYVGEPTFCQNWSEDRHPVYDPSEFTISVAESLKNDGSLPCGTTVRAYHTLPDGTTISQDAVIADIFPDPPGFDPDSEVAYKFNVSGACGTLLQIAGLRSITLEIISLPSGTHSKP